MLNRYVHPASPRLGHGECLEDVVDPAAGDVRVRQPVEPVIRRAPGQAFRDEGPQDGPVRHPIRVGGEPRVIDERRQPERLAEARPLPLAPDGDRDLPVARRERLVRDDVRVGVAQPPRRNPGHEGVLRLVDEHREGGLEDRDVDSLAPGRRPLASEQRAQD